MKVAASIVTSLLASVVAARPPRRMEEGDPLAQESRITAFTVDENGKPSVECWSISKLVETQQLSRRDGSKGRAHKMSLGTSSYDLDGVDLFTFSQLAHIWPPTEDMKASYFDIPNTFNLFTVQGGLINFNFYLARFGVRDDEEVENHVFSMENGDDWFYFEDGYTDSALARSAEAPEYPFEINSISGGETELLRLRYKQRPTHKVLHKGACKFTGLKTPPEDEMISRVHSPLTIQVEL